MGNILGNIFYRAFAKSALFKKIKGRERRTLGPQVVRMFPSQSATHALWNFSNAISILEAQPLNARGIRSQKRTLVFPQKYRLEIAT